MDWIIQLPIWDTLLTTSMWTYWVNKSSVLFRLQICGHNYRFTLCESKKCVYVEPNWHGYVQSISISKGLCLKSICKFYHWVLFKMDNIVFCTFLVEFPFYSEDWDLVYVTASHCDYFRMNINIEIIVISMTWTISVWCFMIQ